MKDEKVYAILHGQLESSLNLVGLSAVLSELNIESRIGESSHYTNGCYLRITCGQAELTFDKIEKSEYLINGESALATEINELVKSISDAFQHLAYKHRFEIYLSSEPSRMIGYFHYNWPQENEEP